MSASPIHALFQQAISLHRTGRVDEAETAYKQIMRADPRNYPARCMLGRLRLEQGRNEEGEKLLAAAVKLDGRAIQGLAFYGVALLRTKKYRAAIEIIERALAIDPNDAALWRNLGDGLRGVARFEDARAAYDQALARDGANAEYLICRAATLLSLKRPEDALADVERALSRMPEDAGGLAVRAQSLAEVGRLGEACEAFAAATRVAPDDCALQERYAALLVETGRHEEAIAAFTAALADRPREIALLIGRGSAYLHLHRFEAALADHEAAVAIDRKSPEAAFSRAVTLDQFGRREDALAGYNRVTELQPDHMGALSNRSAVLIELSRFAEAADTFERILSVAPDHIYAFGGLAQAKSHMCDWRDREGIEAGLRARVAAADVEIHPGVLLAYFDDPALQLVCSRQYTARNAPGESAYSGPAYAHDKIRLAYLSADFHNHATARLAVELFERHDRSRFGVSGISFGAPDGSAMRARCEAAFDTFYDVRGCSDEEVCALLAQNEIDIAIDLKGYTMDARPRILARRPAPLQVSFLGFPGTLGAEYIDYILADETVAPMDAQAFFAENIVQLPACYQPNDTRRAAPGKSITRAQAGLPEFGFVFCCLNNSFKITPAVFDVWMRLLKAVDGAVLWLLEDSGRAVENLRQAAQARGVDPARLVFAPRIDPEAHLARHLLADLFLDTQPYGAHTTASDALWMGVPVVTCLGRAFAGRVCASLCINAGLGELVTEDLAAYERLALELARDPMRLAALKARLLAGRESHPLFNIEGYRRGVEAAFTTMYARYRAGATPAPFAVGNLT